MTAFNLSNQKPSDEKLKGLYAERAKLSRILSSRQSNMALKVFSCKLLNQVDQDILTLEKCLAFQGRH